jgi:DNA-binding PadR family transcriptional regulator
MRGPRNSLKLKTLAMLSRAGRAMEVPELAVSVSYFPVDGFYPYCRRLERWGLLAAMKSAGGKLAYTLTERGRGRLAWLQRNALR